MSEAKDTLLRLIALLRLIPREPGRIATTTLLEKLKDDGFSVSLRTVQRDLDRLSIPFALLRDESSPSFRWSLSDKAPIDLSAMDTPTALALYLAESHLQSLLPQSVLDQLGPQFRMARDYLDNLENNGLAHWARKVRAIPNGKSLQPAKIDTHVWNQTSTALVERKQLQISYLSRSKAELKKLLIHPAGLVSRHSISYLIGSVEGYDDLRQFALHRIQQAERLDIPARSRFDFEIDHYIRNDLNSAAPIKQVELIADVSPQIAWLLGETPLSTQQSLEALGAAIGNACAPWYRKTKKRFAWLFGLGESIHVHEPKRWVDAIKEKLTKMGRLYMQATITDRETCKGGSMKSRNTLTPSSSDSAQDDSRYEIKRDISNTATALSTSETVSRYGSASAEYVKAYTGVDNEAGKVLSKGLKGINQENTGVKQRAGWAGEVASTSRDNAEAIISKSPERTIRSDDLKHYGIETDSKYREAVDRVRVDENGKIIYEAQTKLEASGNRVANQVSHEDHKYSKYFGKKLELPSEQVEDAKTYCRNRAENLRKHALQAEQKGKPELAEKFRERADRFDQLAEEDIVDLGITTEQAIDYAEKPLRETMKDIARTSHRAGIEGAKYGAVIGGVISLLTNAFNVAQDKKQLGEAAQDVALDTAKAGALGYTTAFAGSALKGGMQQSSNQTLRTLSGTNAPALAVTICLSLGSSVKRYVTGEISEAQLLSEVGEKGAGMLSGSMMAALGQLAIPVPFVGAAVGGLIGYALSSFFYQSALDAARGVELSRQQLERVRAIESAARDRIADEQAALDTFTRHEIPQLRQETQRLFDIVSNSTSNVDGLAAAINEYATLLGKQLQFQSMSEFEDFMNSDQPLIL